MKKLFAILFIASVASAASAFAQTADEVKATIARLESPSAKCNGAPEAFKDFVAKASTDADFLSGRINLPQAEAEKYADLLVPENMTAKLPFAKDDDEYYQSWGELQYNKAYLECGWVDSYCTHTFEFTRGEGGKWYLTHIVPGE